MTMLTSITLVTTCLLVTRVAAKKGQYQQRKRSRLSSLGFTTLGPW